MVLGLVRARRGDPGVQELLDEAFELAWPTAELFRMAPVAAGLAEAAWLRGDRDGVDEATDATLELAFERGLSSVAGHSPAGGCGQDWMREPVPTRPSRGPPSWRADRRRRGSLGRVRLLIRLGARPGGLGRRGRPAPRAPHPA